MSDTPSTTADIKDSLGGAVLSESGQAPSRKYSKASQVHEVVMKIIDANQQRDRVFTAWKGLLDGNPPYSQDRLVAAGEGWRSNFNTMEARSLIAQMLVPYWDLFSGGKYLVEASYEGDEVDQDPQVKNLTITEMVDKVLKKDRNFKATMRPMLRDYLAFGMGFLFFPNPLTPEFEHVPFQRVLVPDGTSLKSDKIEVLVIRQEIAPRQLWRWMNKAPENFNRDACIKTIRAAVREQYIQSQELIDLQQLMNSHELFDVYGMDTLKLAHVFIQEYGEKWSHIIVEERYHANDWLFTSFNRYDRLTQFLCPFFLEMMDASWHEAFGTMREVYQLMMLKNRIRCSLTDSAFLRLSVLLQPTTDAAMEKVGLIQMGGAFSFIPPGFTAQQSQVLGDITTALEVNADMDRVVSSNTGVYRPQMARQKGNPETATHEQLNFQQANSITNSDVSNFYDQVDVFYDEWWQRFLLNKDTSNPPAKKFWKRIKAAKLEKDLDDTELAAFRNIGNGSMFMRFQAMQQMAAMYPHMPEDGKQRFMADWIALASGQNHLVERYVFTSEAVKLPTDHHAMAMLENAAIKSGSPVTWTPSQNDVIHAQTHLQAGAEAANQVQQGADPAAVAQFLDGIGAHTAQHLQHLQQDPTRKPELKALVEQWKQLSQVSDGLKEHAQQIQQQRQEQAKAQAIAQGQDPKMQIAAATAARKIALQEKVQAAKMQMKARQTQQTMALKDAVTANSIQNENRKQRFAAFAE